MSSRARHANARKLGGPIIAVGIVERTGSGVPFRLCTRNVSPTAIDVEIAQAASIADPIISVVEDGVILDVRPVVSADRRFVTLEVRPTVAELQRPIRTFVTTLAASGSSVTIQLPEVEKSMIKTSIPMPDGGTVLLGGMKVHENQDLRSGVPILNKIPIISFLFERQGTFVSNRKLLILLKAKIVIPQESQPTPAQMGLDASLALGR